jgi:hypothetical protein
MSKRKDREGGRTEEPVAGPSKRIKILHSESSGAQPNINGERMPEHNTEDVVSGEVAAKQARKLAKRERRKADKEERAKNNESAPKNKKKKKTGANSGWQISDVVGGCLADVDPVFSVDEQ